jgi:hypothetical protein
MQMICIIIYCGGKAMPFSLHPGEAIAATGRSGAFSRHRREGARLGAPLHLKA